jgi:PAS domain S-box-containing protein
VQNTTRFHFRKLHYAIISLLALALVCGGVTLALHVLHDAAEDAEMRAQYNDRLARGLAAHAGASIAEVDNILVRIMATLPEDWHAEPAVTRAILRNQMTMLPTLRNLVVIRGDGTVLTDASGRSTAGMDVSDRSYYRVHADAPTLSLFIAPRLSSRFSDGPVQMMSRPIRNADDALLGVVMAAVDISHFAMLEDGFDLQAGSRMALMGRDGSIRHIDTVAAGLLGRIEKSVAPVLAKGGLQRFRSSELFDGQLRDYSTYPLQHYDLTLVVGTSPRSWQSILEEGLLGVAPGLVSMVSVTVAMGLIFSWYLRRSRGAIIAAEARERQFRDVAHAIPGTLYKWRRTGPGHGFFTWVSPNSIMTLGMAPEEVLRRQSAFSIHPDDYRRWYDSMEAAVAAGTPWNFEGRFILDDGTERLVHTVAGAFTDADGHLTHNGVMIDVTAERHRAVNMAKTEGRLEMLLDAARDAIISLDSDLRITHFNKGAELLFGRPASEMIGGTLDPLLPADFRSRHDKLMQGMLSGPDGSREMSSWRRVNGVRADGSVFPLLASISKTTVLGKPMLCAIMRDMSDEAESERNLTALAEERQRLLVLAEQANTAKQRFLAVMSHELRTPLNAIIGFAELMQMKIGGSLNAQYSGYADDILVSGRHLLSIINDILDLTKLKEQGGDFDLQDVDPVDAIEDAMLFVKAHAAEKTMTLEVIDQAGGAMVRADGRGLRQMLINLMGNAVKYTPVRGHISILARAVPEDGRVVIEVLDNGPGVKETTLARLGKPFVQDRDSYTSENSGTGLGLAIVVELAAAHRGSVSFRNHPEGGFCAALDLPAAAAAASRAA